MSSDDAPAAEDIDILVEPRLVDQRDNQIAELQEEIAELKDKANEERVIFFLVGLAAIDTILVMSGVPSSSFAILVLVQLLALIAIAKRFGVEWVSMIVDRLIKLVVDRLKPG